MDTTYSKYVVEWALSGSTEVSAKSAEQAFQEFEAKVGYLYRNQRDTKVVGVRPISASPANFHGQTEFE